MKNNHKLITLIANTVSGYAATETERYDALLSFIGMVDNSDDENIFDIIVNYFQPLIQSPIAAADYERLIRHMPASTLPELLKMGISRDNYHNEDDVVTPEVIYIAFRRMSSLAIGVVIGAMRSLRKIEHLYIALLTRPIDPLIQLGGSLPMAVQKAELNEDQFENNIGILHNHFNDYLDTLTPPVPEDQDDWAKIAVRDYIAAVEYYTT